MDRLALADTFDRLRGVAPGGARWAEAVLERLRTSGWGAASPRASRLTPSGAPLELAFSSRSEELRWVVDLAASAPLGGSTTRSVRWALELVQRRAPELVQRVAPELAQGVGLRSASPGDLPMTDLAQRFPEGCRPKGLYLGGRRRGAEAGFKLYVELERSGGTPGLERFVRRALGGKLPLNQSPATLWLIGWEPLRDRRELYFEAPGLRAWELERLCGLLGLGARWPELLDLLDQLGRAAPAGELALAAGRFSLRLGRAPAVSVFVPAARSFGGDARARGALLEAAASRGCPMELYAAASAPLGDRPNAQRSAAPAHVLLACSLDADGASFQIGLSPPAPNRPNARLPRPDAALPCCN